MNSSTEKPGSQGDRSTSAVNVSVEADAAAADVAWINERLSEHAAEVIGPVDYVPLTVFLRDAQGRLFGGLLGYSIWSGVQIDSLWVDPSLRRQGYGRSLIQAAERAARLRGCKLLHVETYSRVTLKFYLAAGFSVFGNLWEKEDGFTKYFLRKSV